jgi:hypothetical protein
MKKKEELKPDVYKKKYPKSYLKYASMLLMAALYNLSEDDRNTLFAILDEPPLKDWEFEEIAEQDRRITVLFKVPTDGDNRQAFNCAYRAVLKLTNEKIVLMSN